MPIGGLCVFLRSAVPVLPHVPHLDQAGHGEAGHHVIGGAAIGAGILRILIAHVLAVETDAIFAIDAVTAQIHAKTAQNRSGGKHGAGLSFCDLVRSDALAGAHGRARAAAGALGGVDAGIAVFHGDGVVLALLLAAAAADAGVHAHAAGHAGHVAVAAAHHDVLAGGHEADDVAGAGVDAGAAGGALGIVNAGDAVLHGDGAKGAMIHAVAHADAGEAAVLGTARHGGGHGAALVAVVFIAFLGDVSVAMNDLKPVTVAVVQEEKEPEPPVEDVFCPII